MTGPEREFLMTVQPEMFCMIYILIAPVPKEQNIEFCNTQQGTKDSLQKTYDVNIGQQGL